MPQLKKEVGVPIVRECGGCTACCKTHYVASLEKEMGAWCKYCSIGQGCRIYENRPEECREFACQWLFGTGEEEDRPDRLKVVLDVTMLDLGKGPEVVMGFWEISERALLQQRIKETIQRTLENDTPVYCVELAKKIRLLFVPEDRQVPEELKQQLEDEGFVIMRIAIRHRPFKTSR